MCIIFVSTSVEFLIAQKWPVLEPGFFLFYYFLQHLTQVEDQRYLGATLNHTWLVP